MGDLSAIQPFEFSTVPCIQVAWSGARRLGELLAGRFAARKALIVTDAGLVKCGIVAPAIGSLKAHGFSVSVFDAIVADPPESVLRQCADQAREIGADLVIGLGGGSSLDIAKLVAVLGKLDQPLAAMAGIGNVKGSRLPLALIPTTAGTGS
jgi:alcohol dehydrogenase class IV